MVFHKIGFKVTRYLKHGFVVEKWGQILTVRIEFVAAPNLW